jgi:hypothetical protein
VERNRVKREVGPETQHCCRERQSDLHALIARGRSASDSEISRQLTTESCRRIAWEQISEEPVCRPLAEDVHRFESLDEPLFELWFTLAPLFRSCAQNEDRYLKPGFGFSGTGRQERGRTKSAPLARPRRLSGPGRLAIDDPMVAVFGVAIVSDFHCLVGNI